MSAVVVDANFTFVREAVADLENFKLIKEKSPLDNILSTFDANTVTQSGKTLPKAFIFSVNEVVRTLRESLAEDPSNDLKFRKTADSAKEAIRNYLSGWQGVVSVSQEVRA